MCINLIIKITIKESENINIIEKSEWFSVGSGAVMSLGKYQ
jgi:hypothetical protein